MKSISEIGSLQYFSGRFAKKERGGGRGTERKREK